MKIHAYSLTPDTRDKAVAVVQSTAFPIGISLFPLTASVLSFKDVLKSLLKNTLWCVTFIVLVLLAWLKN